MLKIKLAKKTDVELIALLGRVTYSESHGSFIENKLDLMKYNDKAFSIEQITNEVSDNNNIFFIVFVKKFPVGYAKIIKNVSSEYIKSTNTCRLERIYVLQEFLDQKIGKELFKTVLKTAKELQFEQIWLTTYIKNYRAIRFYEKNNFKHIGDFTFKVNQKPYPNFIYSKKI